MTDSTPLSQAAKAVLDAFLKAPMGQSHVDDDLIAIAAALRAVADHVVPMALCVHNDDFVYVRHQMHAIADELEAQSQ